MYVCICAKITEQDLKDNPALELGTVCGKCIEFNDSNKIALRTRDHSPPPTPQKTY